MKTIATAILIVKPVQLLLHFLLCLMHADNRLFKKRQLGSLEH